MLTQFIVLLCFQSDFTSDSDWNKKAKHTYFSTYFTDKKMTCLWGNYSIKYILYSSRATIQLNIILFLPFGLLFADIQYLVSPSADISCPW